MIRTLLLDLDLQSPKVEEAISLWANSPTLLRCRVFDGKPRPLDLTDYRVGLFLLKGNRTNPTYLRGGPLPSTVGVTLNEFLGVEGFFTAETLPGDLENNSVGANVVLEFYLTKFANLVTVVPSETGGSLTPDTYEYKVTGVFADGTETCPGNSLEAAIAGETGAITVTWEAIPGAASYRLWCLTDGITPWLYRTVTGATTYSHVSGTGWSIGHTVPSTDDVKSLIGQILVQVNPN